MPGLDTVERRYLTSTWKPAASTYEIRGPGDTSGGIEVGNCGPEEAREAIDVAWEAFASWRETTAFDRAALLRAWHDAIIENLDLLAATMTREMGKPIKEARGEVMYAASFVRWYEAEAVRAYGETFPTAFPHKRGMALRTPVGPVYGVTPWNFPAAMVTRKAAPALAAGCTFILKPAEQTPLTALLLADLWREVGGPAGTLQVLPALDPVPVSAPMMEDPRIRKVTFTGSTEVGRILYRQSADTLKRLSLELGGHAPFIVFGDADLEQAVRETIACKFRNAGQTCVCTNRVYVHEDVAEAFTAMYVEAAAGLVVGNPNEESTDVGPLVDAAGLAKVEAHVSDAVSRGAEVRLGGKASDGLYYLPTVLTGITPEMAIMQEETFGPVAPILTFRDEDEVVERANDTPYGLAAYLYTNDLSRAWRMAERLDYGIIGINDGIPAAAYAPFGGVKQSGLGREGGPWGLEEYLEVRYVSMALPH